MHTHIYMFLQTVCNCDKYYIRNVIEITMSRDSVVMLALNVGEL